MKIFFLCIVLLSSSTFPVTAQDRLITGFPELPRDARKVAERSVACQHFAGEMSGDNSERDREVNRTISRLKCNQLEADTERLKRKYRNNPKVLQILGDALSWLET